MSTRRSYNLLLYITVPFLASILSCATPPDRVDQKIKWLNDNAHPITSIHPGNRNYNDLAFLKQELGDAEIVALGESTHGDGSTFLAKTRLIRYLHEELGFDVLAFEGGLYDCNMAWEKLQEGITPDSAFALGPFPVWSESRQLAPLIQLLSQYNSSHDPLILAGFDFQPSGKLKPAARLDSIISFLYSVNPSSRIDNCKELSSIILTRNFSRYRNNRIALEKLFKELGKMISLASTADTTLPANKLWLRYFFNLPAYCRFMISFREDDPKAEIIRIRDSVMAMNITWLKENMYPGKKLILWMANSHSGYNRHLMKHKDIMYPAGEMLKKRYGNKYYAIGFTSFSGKSSSKQTGLYNIPLASNKSIEHIWNKTKQPYAFLPSSLLNHSPFGKVFPARLYGYLDIEAEWSKMTDAIFFINTMEPNTKE